MAFAAAVFPEIRLPASRSCLALIMSNYFDIAGTVNANEPGSVTQL